LSFDIIFAGGGLANTLTACRLRQIRPEIRLLVIEAGLTFGGNHTWSFHATDLTPAERQWIAPFVAHSWPRQEVRFPGHSRILETGYHTIFSHHLHDVAAPKLADCAIFGACIAQTTPTSVRLEDGREFQARCVIDGRGLFRDAPLAMGYQKFVGIEVRTKAPHGQHHPIIMDANIRQTDGYRFLYTLPFTPDRILIEDTYYSDTTSLDVPNLRAACEDYAKRRGWEIAEIIREEKGILPIVLAGDIAAFWAGPLPGVPRAGVRAALFHPTTSYSLPFAVRLAEALARLRSFDADAVFDFIRDWSIRHWRESSFYRLLNRMLFIAADPHRRFSVFERFYRLPQPMIERFYAGRTTLSDQARILFGRPPVSIPRALTTLSESAAWAFVARNGAASGAAVQP